jgi:preprotein translocase subunit SecD
MRRNMKSIFLLLILTLTAINISPQAKNLETGLYLVNPSDSCSGISNKNSVIYLSDTLCLNPKPVITTNDFESCMIDSSAYGGNEIYSLDIKLKKTAAIKFKEITARNVGKKIAFIIDNKVVMAPVVRDRIPSGLLTVGGDKEENIKKLYEKLKLEMKGK